MAELGFAALLLTLLVSGYAGVVTLLGARRHSSTLLASGRNATVLSAVLASVAVSALVALLVARDFGVNYVYQHSSSHLPLGYTVSALWAGQEGSLLLWLWLVAGIAVILSLQKRAWSGDQKSLSVAAVSLTASFLALVLILASNPFERLPSVPAEGMGLNPLLQNIWMTIHPPILFIGYAAYTVPFALAIAGLVTGEFGSDWLRRVRQWALLAWLFLGAGIVMGGWWAYVELGWGGYWAWDPVENSSLIPWLLGTALLHSLLMQQRQGSVRIWNLWLATGPFLFCIFATFVTRSGIIESVHAFGRSSLGWYFLSFMILSLVLFVVLLHQRRNELVQAQSATAILSRESGLFFTNLLFTGAALIVLLGTLFPALVELVQGRQAALDASFYQGTVGPVVQIIVLLMGVCPWLAWGVRHSRLRRLWPPLGVGLAVIIVQLIAGFRELSALLSFGVSAFVGISIVSVLCNEVASRRQRTDEPAVQALFGSLQRNRRRYGAHVVHLGIVLMAIGVTGSTIYQSEVQTTLMPGESTEFQGYRLTYRELLNDRNPEFQRFSAALDVQRGNRRLGTLWPWKDYYPASEQWVSEVAIRSTLREDLYVALAGFERDGLASFQLVINPLVAWLWIGFAMLLAGGCFAWWPASRRGAA